MLCRLIYGSATTGAAAALDWNGAVIKLPNVVAPVFMPFDMAWAVFPTKLAIVEAVPRSAENAVSAVVSIAWLTALVAELKKFKMGRLGWAATSSCGNGVE